MRYSYIVLLLLAGSSLTGAENPVFEAEHLMQCGSWEVAVYQSGYAHEKWAQSCGDSSESYSKLHRISADQIRKIKTVLAQTAFAELPESIDPNTYVADEDMYFFTVFSQQGKRTVKAYGLERAGNRDYAQRFESIWKTITMVVPEPK